MVVITDRLFMWALFLLFLCLILFIGKPDLLDIIKFAIIDNYIHTTDVIVK